MNSNIDQEKGTEYLAEIRRNYEVEMPDIIRSDYGWSIDGNKIRAGFSYIKGVGNSKFEKPTWNNEEGLRDFLELNPKLNKGVVVSLIKAGCFEIDPQWGIDYTEWFKMAKSRMAECRGRIIHYQGLGNRAKVEEWSRKIREIEEPPTVSDYDTPIDIMGEMQKEVLGVSNIDIFAPYDKSLLRGNNRLFYVDKISNFNDRNGNPMFKLIGQGQNGMMTCIFWKPKEDITNKLHTVKEGCMYIVRTGQPKENNTFFCYDLIEAKRVA